MKVSSASLLTPENEVTCCNNIHLSACFHYLLFLSTAVDKLVNKSVRLLHPFGRKDVVQTLRRMVPAASISYFRFNPLYGRTPGWSHAKDLA
jgi:hypothetical protein